MMHKRKEQSFWLFKQLVVNSKKEMANDVKRLRSDIRGEFLSVEVKKFVEEKLNENYLCLTHKNKMVW
jgi:hypothetical protein